MTTPAEVAKMRERLLATRPSPGRPFKSDATEHRNPDGPAASTMLADMVADNERLTALVISEREDNLWSAYATGSERDGKWSHLFMSDGEWLARECGFDPTLYDYDAASVKAAIPLAAARAALEGNKS